MRLGRTATTIHRRHIARQGVTLLEVLVVISIMLILLAVAVPRLRPVMDQRGVREAARTTSAFFYAARNRAMESGRPVGVALERLPIQPEACISLRMVEEPPPYAGDTLNARASVRHLEATDFCQVCLASADVAFMLMQVVPVAVGDFMTFESQFESQAVRYRILGLDQNRDGTPDTDIDQLIGDPQNTPPEFVVLLVQLADVAAIPWPAVSDPSLPFPRENPEKPEEAVGSCPVAFRIYRRPEPMAAMPVRLPAGTVIDLVSSGTDSMALLPENMDPNHWPGGFVPAGLTPASSPAIVMFSPDGRVSQIIYDKPYRDTNNSWRVMLGVREAVTEPLYFLIGRWERIPATATILVSPSPSYSRQASLADDGLYNWQDLTNFWLVVNPNTGLVVTAPVAAPEGGFEVVGGAKVPSNPVAARYDARQMKAVGGR